MIKVAITGPESSGKTTLSVALADHFKIDFIPEFAREFLEHSSGKYDQTDLDIIAKGQLDNILSKKNELTISDTDFIVLEIWSQYKYGAVSRYINELVQKNVFDLHILCTPDIPWEEDPLRENSNSRNELFDLYLKSLIRHNKNFIIVSGDQNERVIKSLKSIHIL